MLKTSSFHYLINLYRFKNLYKAIIMPRMILTYSIDQIKAV